MFERGKRKHLVRDRYDCFGPVLLLRLIMKPELSTAHLGIQDRDLAYEEKKSTITTAYRVSGLVQRSKVGSGPEKCKC
jgi:hypothetical protein